MRVFRFFLTRIFLRKPILTIATLLLLLMANYIAFFTARAVFSTQEGYQQMERINVRGTYIANIDPDATVDITSIPDESIQHVYSMLDEHYTYAFYTDGYMTNLANRHGVEVPVSYMNKRYNDLGGFQLAEGDGLTFDYDLDTGEALPVLVGKGLANDYPLGSLFTMHDPALNRDLTLRVTGVLAEDSSRSNYYALDWKQYYNFSVVIPVTKAFIKRTDVAFRFNGLADLIVTDTDSTAVSELSSSINQTIKVKFNFFSRQDYSVFYNKYLIPSLSFLGAVSGLLLILITGLSVWNSLASVRVMVREFTINLLVGLSYGKVRRLFYSYYAGLSLLALTAVFIMTAYSRYDSWCDKNAFLMTYGFAGLIKMDWLALLVVLVFDLLLVTLIVQLITWRLKRIPISVGVLQ